ncbi:unnamed protein product [Acanthoscelides obtectus]|uniref:Mos1 transposase HTH domain-containing protein n=1 Tax=Acanthoscelides obtectus TaxID=200917 RepID=A0A9P0PPN8_ACAOB|nr:unnamed protein product [Acanthoscelides obtectus]CAK1669865.1 Histone-lysine N-methyltransferase SETMAR [Acanthoscelides obtectus]
MQLQKKRELNREHFRAIIYYNFQRQLSQQECLAELLSVFGDEAPHQSTISRWYGEFKRGRVSLSDDSRVGAPKTAVTQENVDAVRKLIIVDRHMTYREIEASMKISKTSIQKNLHEELGVRKLVSRWIPHLLTEEQKAASAKWCQKTLDRFNSGNSKNVYSIVSGEEKPTKKVATFVSKAGHIATIPLNEQRTVTADWYTTICLSKVITEFRKINPERRIILNQDNASSHTAQKTRQYLTEENVELLDHPPYTSSPDLSPNDFFTFPKVKNRLCGQRFRSPEEAVDAFKNAILDLPANEWNKCFENWFELMQMCINLRGEYFENKLKKMTLTKVPLEEKNEIPTIDKILKQVNDDEDLPNFKRSTFHKLLKELDFRFLKTGRNSLLIEKEEIVIWRREYLRKIRQFRAEGRKIYYLDETWVNAGHTQGKVWTLSYTNLKRVSSVDGFVPEALWAFESKKTGDYHEEMDGNSFENWFKKFLPTLDDNAIIVMDNAPYHSRKLEKIPTMATKKADIQHFADDSTLHLGYLSHCSHAWSATAPTTSFMLDAVQRRAVRLIDDSSLTDGLKTLSHRRADGDLALFCRYTFYRPA